jgi:hypothetical protein
MWHPQYPSFDLGRSIDTCLSNAIFVKEYALKAVRCSICGLLVNPSVNDYGSLKVATPGNHEPIPGEDGYALTSETPACKGSEMLGYVTEATDHALDHLIYDGYGIIDKQGNRIGSTRP